MYTVFCVLLRYAAWTCREVMLCLLILFPRFYLIVILLLSMQTHFLLFVFGLIATLCPGDPALDDYPAGDGEA